MRLRRIDAIILLAGLCAVPAVHAKDGSGAYIGAGIGQASAQDYCANTGGVFVASCDDSDTSFKVYGGYRFTPNFGVEAAYVDLGNYHATGIVSTLPFTIDTELTGVTVQAVGIAPLGDKFSLMGRLGAIFWDMKSSATIGGFPGSSSDNGVDLAIGGSAQFNFTPNFGIRADFDWYPDLGNNDTGEDNIAAATIGVVFSF